MGKRIIETRLLIKKENTWNVATYLWNETQTNATLELNGKDTQVSWINENGNNLTTLYHVPDENECIACHQSNSTMTPLGTKLRNLNRTVERNGVTINQIIHLQSVGVSNDFQVSEVSQIVDYNISVRATRLLTFKKCFIRWQQLFNPINRMLCNIIEDIFQPSDGINSLFLAGPEKGIHHGDALSGIMRACEEVIFSSEGKRTDGVFHQVIVDLQSAVTAVSFKFFFSLEQVIQGFSERRFREGLGIFLFRPSEKFVPKGKGIFLP